MNGPAGVAPRRRWDFAGLTIAALLFGLAGLVAWDAAQLSVAQSYARVGPKAFPYAIAVGLAVLAAATAFTAWQAGPAERPADEPAPILWILGGLIAQLLLIADTGFSVATGVLFAATARAFGRGPFVLTIPVGILAALVIWILFAKGLDLTLPAGPLERLI